MKNNWMFKAVLLGLVFFIAVLLVKPVGVSTQFSMLSGLMHNSVTNTVTVVDESKQLYTSSNAYYAKSSGKLIKAMQNPINYDFLFVLAIPLGAYAAARLLKDKQQKAVAENKPVSNAKLFLNGFIGGFIILYGSRMAGGCTSGHMMSGMMQGSISGYVFAAAVFLAAIPTAILLKKLSAKDDIK